MTTITDRSFLVRTFGCQMNKHDAERVSGMLASCGMIPVDDAGDADVVIFLTCCVRENAEERLRGTVASLKAIKSARNGVQIAVGGCIGQRDGEALLDYLPHVDVVFGTHNVGRLPYLLDLASQQGTPVVEVLDGTADFITDLPSQRLHPWHAWLPIMVGCDNYCTYCIVPYVRGPERSRTLEDVVAEARLLVSDGVREITLLGQNVNSYGRDIYGETRFAEVLRAIAASGIDRVRFATSHPKDLSSETIAVMRDTPQVCRALHLPVQSGSDAVLERMNRKYGRQHYLDIVEKLYAAMPDLALSTDIIVGFPGETDEDFDQTMDLLRTMKVDQAFTFIYSPREGTAAASMGQPVPRAITQERFDRLVLEVQASAQRKNDALLGTIQRVLVEGPSKRDKVQLTGRSDGNKVVHAPVPSKTSPSQLAGSFVDIEITTAHKWFLAGRIIS